MPYGKAAAIALMFLAAAAWTAPIHAQSNAPQVPTDWDLYMLKLVNRARTDPAGEDLRQATNYNETTVGPLAYDLLVGRAAQNHNQWMGLNRNNQAIDNPANSPPVPDSFAHYETLNGQADGTSATETPGYSGADIGARMTYAGFAWRMAAENILWRSNTPAIDAALVEDNHHGWWTSDGHRHNLMSDNYTAFGHHAMNDDDHWATQDFARPWFSDPQFYALGMLYDDQDDSGAWEPHDTGDPEREGLAGQTFQVFEADTNTQIGDTYQTMDNGAFSVPLDEGIYDIKFFLDPLDRFYTFQDVVIDAESVDLGDLDIGSLVLAGDMNNDGNVDGLDVDPFVNVLVNGPFAAPADMNGDGQVNGLDVNPFVAAVVGGGVTAVPEPPAIALAGFALAALMAGRRRRSGQPG